MAYVLQQLLSKSAKAYPEKVAVWARGRSITYRELDERSNQMAHLLRKQGIKKGDRVGLFFPKCVESVISMLGVLKAAGVVVRPIRRLRRTAWGSFSATAAIPRVMRITNHAPP